MRRQTKTTQKLMLFGEFSELGENCRLYVAVVVVADHVYVVITVVVAVAVVEQVDCLEESRQQTASSSSSSASSLSLPQYDCRRHRHLETRN